ncbi:unknown protein [Seminavis robusta]|uniref:Uncharacterized protein n=1 Tax=Seminavis robusta TaxID=568900 RepID=A0A9N8EMD2_9STRA|nr:unknown protein [Seminavis robusta]|eukprot:Sro1465_g274980.1 n/a (103) ;mRNA; r:11820-12128
MTDKTLLSGWLSAAAAAEVKRALEEMGADIKIEGNVMTVAFTPANDPVDNLAAALEPLRVQPDEDNGEASDSDETRISDDDETGISEEDDAFPDELDSDEED